MSEETDRLYDEEMAAQKKRHDDWMKYQEKMKRDHAAQIALQEREAEAERLEKERIANLPTPEQAEFPIAGLHFVNGAVVNKPAPILSQGAIKTRQLSESFAAIRNKK